MASRRSKRRRAKRRRQARAKSAVRAPKSSARAAKSSARTTSSSRAKAVPRRKAAPPVVADDEARLLGFARDLTAVVRTRPPAEALDEALASLPEVEQTARPDAARALALGWAREHARLALAEVFERGAKAGAVRDDVPADTLAWLVLAAAEAMAREPADAAPDRLHAISTFVRPPAPRR